MRIAVEGCYHGELDKIYAALAHLEKVENVKVDLLICCGDFQGVRNARDLKCMSCLLYTSPSPRDRQKSRMPSSA